MLACIFIHLYHLGFGDLKGKNTTYALAAGMHMQHDLCRTVMAKTEKCLDHIDHKIHGGKIVIQQHHLLHRRWFDLGPGLLQRQTMILM
jgi:hypothetical protein